MPFFKVGEVRVADDSDFKTLIDLVDDNTDWTQDYSKNDISVHSKSTPVSYFKIVKVKSKLKGVSASTLYDVIQDPDYRKVWDKSMIEGYEICQINPNNDIGYYSMRSIPPFKNRDFVTQRSWLQTNTESIIFNHSVFHEKAPSKKSFIRAVSHITGYVIRPIDNNSCSLIYVAQVDPRGKLPTWAVNKATCYVAPRVMIKLAKAAAGYEAWKKKHASGFKPWLFPEQIDVPRINWAEIRDKPDYTADNSIDESQAQEVASEQAKFDRDCLAPGNGDSGQNSPATKRSELPAGQNSPNPKKR